MTNCIICLDRTNTTLFNLCEICNNFTVCENCYSMNNIHTINSCPHCRTKLTKIFDFSFQTLKLILHYYTYSIVHILFNIIYSNIFLFYYFPRNNHISPVVSTTITHLMLVNNFANFLIIPFIYSSFKYNYRMSVIYAFVNILYSFVFYTTPRNTHIQLYYIYYVLYFYILTLLKYTVISIYYLLVNFNISRIHLLHTNSLYLLNIYNNVRNGNNQITPV
jgi:hypothetical protein